jgi:prevent-host-death family protein
MKKVSVSVAEAKREFSELLGRVAYGKETITITRHGKPMAILAPPGTSEGLASVKGWLDNDDPFFEEIQDIVADRKKNKIRRVRLSRS